MGEVAHPPFHIVQIRYSTRPRPTVRTPAAARVTKRAGGEVGDNSILSQIDRRRPVARWCVKHGPEYVAHVLLRVDWSVAFDGVMPEPARIVRQPPNHTERGAGVEPSVCHLQGGHMACGLMPPS